jgi:CRISPR-associated protein, csd1 family
LSWIDKLYETYENCQEYVGKDREDMLLPIAHTTNNAQIQVTLNQDAEIVMAEKVPKENAVTIIPCTEDSASRGVGIFPHALFDKLIYIAGDYADSISEKGRPYHEAYETLLDRWCASEDCHPQVQIIARYLKKNCLIQDLVRFGCLVEKEGAIDPSVKIGDVAQTDAFVRFCVNRMGVQENPRVWENPEVWQSYIRFYEGQQENRRLCYVTGQVIPCTDKHPSKIRNSADKAKLISANDKSGFTFRGRFADKQQALSVGYEISQKAHNALKWLIAKQGYKNGDQVILTWETKRLKAANPVLGSQQLMTQYTEPAAEPKTMQAYARKLNEAIAGYKNNLDRAAKVVVMGLDSAIPDNRGRLAITYYRELPGSEFYDRIQRWYRDCCWELWSWKDEQFISYMGSPSPHSIAVAAYGKNADKKLLTETVERLLPCIVDQAKLPFDLVQSVYNRVRTLASSASSSEWIHLLSICCALGRCYGKERDKEEWTVEGNSMELDKSYLCGRLLAVMDGMEKWALAKMGEDRQTNAMRYLDPYTKNAGKIIPILQRRLLPYMERIGDKHNWLLETMGEICEKLSQYDGELKALDYRFTLGFYTQQKQIRDETKRRKAEAEK